MLRRGWPGGLPLACCLRIWRSFPAPGRWHRLWLACSPLGIRGPAALDAIAACLAGASALLVLDNCEHVIEESAQVARVLVDRCPGLTVLATSREPLLVSGEAIFPLTPLPEDEAGRLFTERARDRSPGFDGSASPALIRRICSRLDGLPLAIELATARVTLLGADEIEDRLARRSSCWPAAAVTARPGTRGWGRWWSGATNCSARTSAACSAACRS